MAKTKQTAKKSTGGSAKRKLLAPPARVLRSQSARSRGTSRSPQVTPDIDMTELDSSISVARNLLPVPASPAETVADEMADDTISHKAEATGGSEADYVSLSWMFSTSPI